MEIYDYFQAGYAGRTSEQPPYASSTFGQAYQCGVWCRTHGHPAQEIKQSRGHTWIVNRSLKLNFKADDYNPIVTRIN